jgi:malonyl-CoA decarboxylase
LTIPDDVDALVQRDRQPAPLGTTSEKLQRAVLSLAAFYLLRGKQGDGPLDRVARFHLANGARIERLNWMGDASENGLRQSLGVTVNYVYRLADVERHHEAYAAQGKIAASHELHTMARTVAGR